MNEKNSEEILLENSMKDFLEKVKKKKKKKRTHSFFFVFLKKIILQVT